MAFLGSLLSLSDVVTCVRGESSIMSSEADMSAEPRNIEGNSGEAIESKKSSAPCDNPGCPNRSLHKCTGCLSVFYCSQTCQKAHWQEHKTHCKVSRSLAALNNINANFSDRLKSLRTIDTDEDTYQLALSTGRLWSTIVALLREDNLLFRQRLRGTLENRHCWTRIVLGSIFEFNRGSRSCKGINFGRFNSFLEEEDAWPTLLDSMKNIMAITIESRDQALSFLNRDIMRVVGSSFSNNSTCKRILSNHTALTCAGIRALWETVREQDELGADPGSAMEGMVYQMIAALDIMARRHNIPADVHGQGVLDLIGVTESGPKKGYYMGLLDLAKPYAEDEIARFESIS